jgi:RHS repeat-associated protein
VQNYNYDPYGATTVDISGGPANPWRYAGTYQDATGLYKMGMRYYAPGLMRWTQQDAIEAPTDFGMINRYAYVGGDPLNQIDPSGLSQGCGGAIARKKCTDSVFGACKTDPPPNECGVDVSAKDIDKAAAIGCAVAGRNAYVVAFCAGYGLGRAFGP